MSKRKLSEHNVGLEPLEGGKVVMSIGGHKLGAPLSSSDAEVVKQWLSANDTLSKFRKWAPSAGGQLKVWTDMDQFGTGWELVVNGTPMGFSTEHKEDFLPVVRWLKSLTKSPVQESGKSMKKYSMLQFESLVRKLVKSRLQEVLKETDSGNTSINQKKGYGAYGPGGPRSAGVQISGQPMMDEEEEDSE